MLKMSLTDRRSYHYHLPGELIAQYPPIKRDNCRLLHLDRNKGHLAHHRFAEIEQFLNSGDVLVLNTSKVIPARLKGKKESGAGVEVLLLKEIQTGFWECMVRPGSKLKIGTRIIFSDQMQGTIADHLPDGLRLVQFHYEVDFWQLLDVLGEMPLPPYIKRKVTNEDFDTYQTVYATERGSAAAPTAGLHFTDQMLKSLSDKGIIIARVILHIGLDTFRPVKSENILDHKMHREYCSISPETSLIINQAKCEGRRVIAVGTTSVRTLESFAQATVGDKERDSFQVGFYSDSPKKKKEFTPLSAGSMWSQLFIYPGYTFKVIDGLLTNFHLPESTLMMLVSAFAGYENILKAYESAVKERYRFFSYGDAMLIL